LYPGVAALAMFEASIIMRWLRSWSAAACTPKSFSDAI
jgi:hypothetical protein